MARRLISSGSRFEREYGYSRAIVQGPWVFVSGTTGYDYASMTMPADVVAQTRASWATPNSWRICTACCRVSQSLLEPITTPTVTALMSIEFL